jgi:hypothetical protein
MSDMTISSHGFVNYFPSSERTQRETEATIKKYGTDVVIINGEDDWNASIIFKIGSLLEKFKINSIGTFHDGISGITNSGRVIAKADLPNFIKKYNKYKWQLWRANPGQMCLTNKIKIFDPSIGHWQKFFELTFGDTVVHAKLKLDDKDVYQCKHEAFCTFNNFKPSKKDVSLHFSSHTIQWYWKCKFN